MLMQNLGGQTKSTMVFSEVAYYVTPLIMSRYFQIIHLILLVFTYLLCALTRSVGLKLQGKRWESTQILKGGRNLSIQRQFCKAPGSVPRYSTSCWKWLFALYKRLKPTTDACMSCSWLQLLILLVVSLWIVSQCLLKVENFHWNSP